jgi:hypothetical protein
MQRLRSLLRRRCYWTRELVENRRISYCTPWNALSFQSTLQLARNELVRIVLLLGKTHDADENNFTIIMSAGCKRKISLEHEKKKTPYYTSTLLHLS